MASKFTQEFPLPEKFSPILKTLIKCLLRDQPVNIILYAAQYFEQLQDPLQIQVESILNLQSAQEASQQPMALLRKNNSQSQLIREVHEELMANETFYGEFIDMAVLKEMTSLHQRMFIDEVAVAGIVTLLIDFMSYAINQNDKSQKLKSTLTNFYYLQIASRWQRIRDPAFLYNKGHLKVLSFIVPRPKSWYLEYGDTFQYLKFDLSIEEGEKVAAIVKSMCKEHLSAFCYLTNYFLRSIGQLQAKGVTMDEIQSKYSDVLSRLNQLHKPAPRIQHASQQVFETHPSCKHTELVPRVELDLSIYKQREQKEAALDDFILERSSQAASYFEEFSKMVRKLCQQNGGYRVKVGLKIKDRNNLASLNRIKQKIFSQTIQTILEAGVKIKEFDTKVSYAEGFKREKLNFKEILAEIITQYEEPVPFKVSDMLRGKSMFSDVANINACCSQILNHIQSEGKVKLVQINNRLRMKNSDLVLKLLYGNVVAELQLVIDLNSAEYEFSHKLYELERSKFYSQMTQLSVLNDKITQEYLSEASEVIACNTSCDQPTEYHERVTFHEVKQNFKDFLQMIGQSTVTERVKIDISLMQEEKKQLRFIKQSSKTSNSNVENEVDKLFSKAKYYIQLKQPDKAVGFYEKALELKEKKYGKDTIQSAATLNNLGIAYSNMGQFERALQFYEQSLKIKRRVKGRDNIDCAYTLNNMGLIYSDSLHDYDKAEQLLLECLSIKERAKGKDSRTYSETSTNLGQVYQSKKQYDKAHQCLNSSLQCRVKHFGKESTQVATTLVSIGMVYDDQRQYAKAIEYYEKGLEIEQKVKGKGSINTAETLNNIGVTYEHLGNYTKAIDYYQQCLQITERVKGKDHADCAFTLKNMARAEKSRSNYPQAVSYSLLQLQIEQKVWGKEHKYVKMTTQKLAETYILVKDYSKAIEYYKRVLEYKERSKGKEHIDVAATLDQIGEAFKGLNNYSQAIEYYQRSLEIKEKVKGKNDISLVNTLFYMAKMYQQQRELPQAIESYNRCLQIEKQSKGQDHIDTSVTLFHLGNTYELLKDYDKAIECYYECKVIEEKVKGREHYDVSTTLNNIGNVCISQKQYSKAVDCYLQSLRIKEQSRGKDSYELAATLQNIAIAYKRIQKYPQAIENLNRCLKIKEQVKGKGQIQNAPTLQQLGNVYKSKKDYQMALQYYFQSLEIRDRIKGMDHKDSFSVLSNLAEVFKLQRNYSKSIEYYERVLAIEQVIKGKEHINVSVTLFEIANAYENLNNYEKALEYYHSCLNIEQKVRGPDHEDTAITLKNIADVYKSQSNYSKAVETYERCLNIREKLYGRESPKNIGIIQNLLTILVEQGNASRAIDYFQTAVLIHGKDPSKLDTSIMQQLLGLANALRNQLDSSQALVVYEFVSRVYTQLHGHECSQLAEVLEGMAACYHQQQNDEQAQAHKIRAQSIRDTKKLQ